MSEVVAPLASIPIPGIPTLFEFAVTEAIASTITNEFFSWWTRRGTRGDYYQLAIARAKNTGRPLIVIGDPDAHVTRGEVGYGELCVDLTGCPLAPNGVKADITMPGSIRRRDGTIVPDNSAVVVVFCVLEYVDDIDAAWKEITRVAGDFSNIFVVYVDQMTLSAWFYPGALNVITGAPPTNPTLEYKSARTWTPRAPVVPMSGWLGALLGSKPAAALPATPPPVPAGTTPATSASKPAVTGTGHFRVLCSGCGDVMRQCSCPSEILVKGTTYERCDKCLASPPPAVTGTYFDLPQRGLLRRTPPPPWRRKRAA